jgi:hypothetical protein
MISKISSCFRKQISFKGLNKNLLFTSKSTVHLNFSPFLWQQQKRFYDKRENPEEDNENKFVPPSRYPKGILRSNIENRKGLGGENVMKTDIWAAIKKTSRRGFFGKLALFLGFLAIVFGVSMVFAFIANTQNNLTIYLKDADKLRHEDLLGAVEYYTAHDFPRILAGHPIFNYSSVLVLQQDHVRGDVMETDSFGFAKVVKTKFSFPPTLDLQLFFSTEIHPNYVTRDPPMAGAISVRPDYEYLIFFNKIVMYFIREKKSQIVPRNDKFFPKRNILSAAHYQRLYSELIKQKELDRSNYERSQGQIQDNIEETLYHREVELQKQDKAIKEGHHDPRKR